jgi:hypothetical protein
MPQRLNPDLVLVPLMCLYGLWYAVTRLIFHYHWQRQEFTGRIQKYGWALLNFTPVGWILYPTLKPWSGLHEPSAEPATPQVQQTGGKWLRVAMYLGIAWTVVTIVVILVLSFHQ